VVDSASGKEAQGEDADKIECISNEMEKATQEAGAMYN
jgi:hypothetical protein